MTPCERFTVLESRQGQPVSRCDVCEHTEASHADPGQRVLSGAQVEEIRRRMLMENFDKFQEDRQRTDAAT